MDDDDIEDNEDFADNIGEALMTLTFDTDKLKQIENVLNIYMNTCNNCLEV